MPPKKPLPAGGETENTLVEIIVALVVLFLLVGFFGSYGRPVLDKYVNLVDWIYSRNWHLWKIIFMIVFGTIDVGLGYLALVIFWRYEALLHEVPAKDAKITLVSPQEEFNRNWKDVKGLMDSQNPSDWNMAILRADAELDDLLNHLGYEGETFAERLKIVDPTKLKSVDRIWSAHRLRNTIAHDPLQQYTRDMIVHALESYEIAFTELGFLKRVEA